MNLEIKNLNIDNYNINLTIYENEKIGIFSRKQEITSKLLEVVSGINKNNQTAFINGSNIFDNKEYFSNRLFFDFKRNYLTTLRVNKIEQALKDYNLELDKENFVNICKDLNIRGETDITYKYEFTPVGNSFVNLALLCSLNKKNIIVNNPLINLNLKSDFDYFTAKLTSTIFQSAILGIDRLDCFRGKLNRVVFFSDFNECISINNNDTLIVFDNDIDKYYLIKNKLFKGRKIISLNNTTKEDLKLWQRQKVNYEIISLYDIEKYLGEL